MNYEDAACILSENNQSHILKFWKRLSEKQQKALLAQVAELDFTTISKMRALLTRQAEAPTQATAPMAPAHVTVLDGEARHAAERIDPTEGPDPLHPPSEHPHAPLHSSNLKSCEC